MGAKKRVLVWNEFRHEQVNEKVRAVYPNGIHHAIGEGLGDELEIGYVTLDEPEHGLTEQKLKETDVLIWWGHKAHHEVADEIVERGINACWRGWG